MQTIMQVSIVLVGTLLLTTQFFLGLAAICCIVKEWAFAGVIVGACIYLLCRWAGVDGLTCMRSTLTIIWLGGLTARVISSPANGLLVIPIAFAQVWAAQELMG
jgi:hypothetical protein